MQTSDKYCVKNSLLLMGPDKIQVGSPKWYEWLSTATKFSFEGQSGHFIAQRELRRDKAYWYAYRRRAGKLTKVYLGKSEELTAERLEQACISLAGQDLLKHFVNQTTEVYPSDTETRIDTYFLPMTKVNVPVLPRILVTRPRLTRQINTPLTLIYAPSGFGKSTLLNDWKQTCGHPVAWLSVDEHDNQPMRFWYSMVMALQTVDPAFGKELLAYLNAPSPIPLPEVVSHLTNDIVLSSTTTPRLGLVLDDFHHIHNSEIYDFLQAWLEHFPPSLQLIISGHTRPPLSLGHLRAKGLLTELESTDLRFTLEEGIHYLQQYSQEPPLAYDDIEKLVKHAEGWAAGLTLTALALGKQENRRQFIDTFSGAHIYMREYFMETVLQRCTPDVQAFLLKTGILKHLTGSLCDVLTGQTDGAETLAHLWHENLFIVQLEQQGWYRYHDLFAEMLRSQLQARFPEEIPRLHQRAAQWYREQYAPADAIYHLLAAEAWEEATSLVEEMALHELEQYGEDSRLLRWLEDLPKSVVQQHKTLLFVYLRLAALAFSRKNTENIVLSIEANIARKPASQLTPDEQEVLIEIRRIRQAWAEGNTFILSPTAGGENDTRWELLNGLCLLTSPGKLNEEDTDEKLAHLCDVAQTQQNLFVILMAGGARARRMILRGQLRSSEKIAQQILQQAIAQRGKLPEPASIALAALSQIHFERNDLDSAQKFLQRAVEVDPDPTSTNMPIQMAIMRAKIQSAHHKENEARATLQAAQELHARRPSGGWGDLDLVAYEALICLRNGDISVAEQLLGQAGEPSTDALRDLIYAEISFKRKQLDRAETLLTHLISAYPHGMPYEPLMRARVLLALVLLGQHKINQARQTMAESIRLAAPEKFIRPFLEHGSLCVPLLTLVLQTEKLTTEAQGFIEEILQVSSHAGKGIPVPKAELEALSTAASISLREQEVLRLMSAGSTNREIAEKLCISESTVKTHLSNIYYKLNVNSRVQAILRAKELSLV